MALTLGFPFVSYTLPLEKPKIKAQFLFLNQEFTLSLPESHPPSSEPIKSGGGFSPEFVMQCEFNKHLTSPFAGGTTVFSPNSLGFSVTRYNSHPGSLGFAFLFRLLIPCPTPFFGDLCIITTLHFQQL